ncbi:MAG: SDR family oxidoreductase [Pseudomonadota bacterium]
MDMPRFDDLDGASVFISGGGKGIGAGLTEAFLRQGAHVAFVQRSDASDFADQMETETGRRPLPLICDVTEIDTLKAALGEAAAAHGPVTVLISNAANDDRHRTEEVSVAYWDRAQAINLRHYFFAAQAVIAGMRGAGGGSIINLSSISYMMGLGGMPAYTAANGAITALTRGLARELGPDRIRVNALAPGWVLTERQKELWVTEEGLKSHLAQQCIPQALAPADIAGPALFLASRASAMITGQLLAVDGGVVSTG